MLRYHWDDDDAHLPVFRDGLRNLALLTGDPQIYFSKLADAFTGVRATDCAGAELTLADALESAIKLIADAQAASRKLMLVGNGGSGAIASHMAVDFVKMSGVAAVAFNDPVHLTCFSNDYGFEELFAESVKAFGANGDVLLAMSCSGRSPNILRAVEAAREVGVATIAMGGFNADAPLTKMGDLNFYVDSDQYGLVQIAHLSLIHYMSDWFMERRGR